MIRIKVWVLLTMFAILGVSCTGATSPAPTPGATASPPSQVWILQPQDGDNLSVNHAHLIRFQGASFNGIDQFQVKAADMQWSVEPLSTGSGGPDYGTMFFGEVSWTPNATGQNLAVRVRAMNASGSSPWSVIHVNVVEIPVKKKPTVTPRTPVVRITLTPTQLIIYARAKMNANCRAGPGTVYNETGFIPKDDQAEVVGRNESGTWLKLVNPNGKGSCWASIIAFEVEFDTKLLPVALAPPTPSSSGQGESEGTKPKGCIVTNPLTGQTSCVSPCPAGAAPGRACTP